MKCIVDGCDRPYVYKAAKLCQMHYFRVRRNGTAVKTPIIRALKYLTPNGYVSLYKPGHPLSNKTQCVFEHRFVMWPIVGPDCRPCELCGKPQTWATCHVDHIDENRQNNAAENLRILCRGCNVRRGFTPESHANRGEIGLIEFEGKRNTPAGWARDDRVMVSGSTIILRKKQGMSDYEALFSPKITHNGKPKTDNRPKKTQHKHERSNSVPLAIEGFILSAAEWAREAGVTVTEASIINRSRAGWGEAESIFTAPRGKPLTTERLEEIKAHYRAKVRELKALLASATPDQ